MERIRLLQGEWNYDPDKQLGRAGGFGAVFAGHAHGFGPLAVKRLHIKASEAAHRELRLAEELSRRDLQHVIPIFDCGKDADSDRYYVVMPRAERSLQEEIDTCDGFSDREASQILLDIASGLAEVPDIVHRDLKPANVLLHQGRWKISDFGIARFVEDSTSLNTLKGCLTPQYAAPEQWRLERASHATDLYALGCIAYALLTGEPPFSGPGRDDLSQQHQKESPPPLEGHAPGLRSLASMLLRKILGSRPEVFRAIETLRRLIAEAGDPNLGTGLKALSQAGVKAAEVDASKEAERAQEESRNRTRDALASAAFQSLHEIVDRLFEVIECHAPTAKRGQNGGTRTIVLGQGTLRVECISGGQTIPDDAFSRTGWDLAALAHAGRATPAGL